MHICSKVFNEWSIDFKIHVYSNVMNTAIGKGTLWLYLVDDNLIFWIMMLSVVNLRCWTYSAAGMSACRARPPRDALRLSRYSRWHALLSDCTMLLVRALQSHVIDA